jgi:nitroreductase
MQNSNIFTERRSINFFDKEKPLPKGMLKQIIDLAVLAPSAFNLQPWRIIAIESNEAKQKFSPLANGQPKIVEAPVTLIIVGDKDGWNEQNRVWKDLESKMGPEAAATYKEMVKGLYGSTAERKIKFAESNGGLLSMSIMYAAKTFGIESHAMSGIDFEGIKKSLTLKESEGVVMIIALGYLAPDTQLYPRSIRFGFDQIVTTL